MRFLFLVLRKGIVVNGLVLFQRDGRVWLGGWRNIEKKNKQTKEPRKDTDTFGVKENGKAQEMVPASHSRIQNTRGVGKQVYIDIDIQSK